MVRTAALILVASQVLSLAACVVRKTSSDRIDGNDGNDGAAVAYVDGPGGARSDGAGTGRDGSFGVADAGGLVDAEANDVGIALDHAIESMPIDLSTTVPAIKSVLYFEDFESGAHGWTDGDGNAASLATDATAPSGTNVQAISRPGSVSNYRSPWIDTIPGQTYCVSVNLRWIGGSTPFVGIQRANGTGPDWLVGMASYLDSAFGATDNVSPSVTGWQIFSREIVLPSGTTQIRLVNEVWNVGNKGGSDLAYFDGFQIATGRCGTVSILVFAPHPDDDIVTSSGIISRALHRGEQVHVVFLTNGDRASREMGTLRQDEAVAAQGVLGLGEDNLIFLGYPDGVTAEIRTNYTNATDRYTSSNGVSQTYASRGLGRMNYHSYAFGSPAAYNGPNMVLDMASVLTTYLPDHIFLPSKFDAHTDHQTACQTMNDALRQVLASHPSYRPVIHQTIVWAPRGDWPTWPSSAAPNQFFTIIPTLASTSFVWGNRESMDVPLVMQSTALASNLKYMALAAHASQGGGEGIIGNFLHKDEIFWPERPANPDNLPPVVNAGLDQIVKAADSVTLDGSASVDPEGVGLICQWTQVDGPAVALSNATSCQATFTAPTSFLDPTTLTFELVVADGLGWTVPDAVSIIVNPLSTWNQILDATAVASSESSRQTATMAIDGALMGYPAIVGGEWASDGEKAGAWIKLSWANPVMVSRVVLYDRPNANDQVLAGTLSFSDGSSVDVGALDNGGRATEFTFTTRQILWIQFTVAQVSGTTENIGLEEFQVWSQVSSP
jgi:LmbE family N-acetylglucosaminyl deacetylase